MPYVLSKKGRSRKQITSIYYFDTNLSDTKGYDRLPIARWFGQLVWFLLQAQSL